MYSYSTAPPSLPLKTARGSAIAAVAAVTDHDGPYRARPSQCRGCLWRTRRCVTWNRRCACWVHVPSNLHHNHNAGTTAQRRNPPLYYQGRFLSPLYKLGTSARRRRSAAAAPCFTHSAMLLLLASRMASGTLVSPRWLQGQLAAGTKRLCILDVTQRLDQVLSPVLEPQP